MLECRQGKTLVHDWSNRVRAREFAVNQFNKNGLVGQCRAHPNTSINETSKLVHEQTLLGMWFHGEVLMLHFIQEADSSDLRHSRWRHATLSSKT